jgi:aryl-alcohol dehydrogenase (NADP+)
MLTGRVRKNQENGLRRAGMLKHLNDERRIDVVLTDDILDRIDEIVPPGTDVTALDQDYRPPALQIPSLRRRPLNDRAAA